MVVGSLAFVTALPDPCRCLILLSLLFSSVLFFNFPKTVNNSLCFLYPVYPAPPSFCLPYPGFCYPSSLVSLYFTLSFPARSNFLPCLATASLTSPCGTAAFRFLSCLYLLFHFCLASLCLNVPYPGLLPCLPCFSLPKQVLPWQPFLLPTFPSTFFNLPGPILSYPFLR